MSSKLQKLYRKIDKAQAALYKFQSECKHEKHLRVYKANDGNYDPSSDSYWVECKCHKCDKRWTEDQ